MNKHEKLRHEWQAWQKIIVATIQYLNFKKFWGKQTPFNRHSPTVRTIGPYVYDLTNITDRDLVVINKLHYAYNRCALLHNHIERL